MTFAIPSGGARRPGALLPEWTLGRTRPSRCDLRRLSRISSLISAPIRVIRGQSTESLRGIKCGTKCLGTGIVRQALRKAGQPRAPLFILNSQWSARRSNPTLPILCLLFLLAFANSLIAAQPLAPSPSPSAQTPDTLDDKHKLAIGDRLSFRILEDQEDPEEPREPKSLVVADSGELEVPYLGRFPAENKTCKQLALQLKAALEKDYYHRATVLIAVDLMAKTRGKVYLVGPVRVPGPQEIPSDEVLTLSKAIMRAGGFGEYANKKNVKVTRKGAGPGDADKKTFVVDVEEILEKGRVERDLVLEPGDLILVPEQLIRF